MFNVHVFLLLVCNALSSKQRKTFSYSNLFNIITTPPLLILSSLCTPRDLPLTVQSCVMPKDCQVTDWAEWGPCSKTCVDPETSRGNRSRIRQVLQFPVGEGAECPPLEESESCEPVGEGVPPCATWVPPVDRGGRQEAQQGLSF